MADPDTQQAGGERLFTLSDISQKTGISMPTLQRYKKLYQGRIPSVGAGRKQRYPESALPVFDELRHENIGRRGRPRKDASAKAHAGSAGHAANASHASHASSTAKPAGRRRGRPPGSGRKAAAAAAAAAATPRRRPGRPRKNATLPAAAAAAKPAARRGRPPGRRNKPAGGSGNLLTLTQISEQTGISYPTLVRYVRLHEDRLPHEGKGRARRFYPQAVDAFREMRQESGRGGRKPGRPVGSGRGAGSAAGRRATSSGDSGAFAQRLKAIEKSQQAIEKRFRGLIKTLQKLFR